MKLHRQGSERERLDSTGYFLAWIATSSSSSKPEAGLALARAFVSLVPMDGGFDDWTMEAPRPRQLTLTTTAVRHQRFIHAMVGPRRADRSQLPTPTRPFRSHVGQTNERERATASRTAHNRDLTLHR